MDAQRPPEARPVALLVTAPGERPLLLTGLDELLKALHEAHPTERRP